MLESWVNDLGMIHQNKSELCEGVYTYGRIGQPRSAIDHVLINTKMGECFRGMRIDENAEKLNMSDHNLIRSWYKIGREKGTSWRKARYEERTWYVKDEKSLKKMEELEGMIRGPTSFSGLMNKTEIAQEKTLKKTRKIKIGNKGKKPFQSAEWMDAQAIVYIRERKIKSRAWRFARRRNAPQHNIDILKKSYEE